MLPNGFVEITCVKPHYRYSWRERCGIGQCSKYVNEVLSSFVRHSFSAYGFLPFIASQVVEDGAFDVYSYFVTFPQPCDTRYIVCYCVDNDLPF